MGSRGFDTKRQQQVGEGWNSGETKVNVTSSLEPLWDTAEVNLCSTLALES